MVKKTVPAASAQGTSASAPAAEQAPRGPTAAITIDYKDKGDYLGSFDVIKYNGAEIIKANPGKERGGSSIVRFDGGVDVWNIAPDKGVLSSMPGFDPTKKFAVRKVKYGELPDHFAQLLPDSGPPEPLEPGHYYVFSVRHNSGTQNVEAVKVMDDGTIEGYGAEPLAGTSYLLCCNVNADFTSSPEAPAAGEAPAGP